MILLNQKYKYYSIYKPYGFLSQFSDADNRNTLKALANFPKDVYPVGRLDMDSEGLLILTNDAFLNDRLLNPKFMHFRTYLAQVEGEIDEIALTKLKNGVEIAINGKTHLTAKAKANSYYDFDSIPERTPPVRFRKSIPTSWLELSLREGKNRQVRKMTAKVGFPTLRLIRYSIEKLTLDSFQPSIVKEYEKEEIYNFLNINPNQINKI